MKDDNPKTPEPFFHESENFSSAYFGKLPEHIAGKSKDDSQIISRLASLLTDEANRQLKEELLNILRVHDARGLLMNIIGNKKYAAHRAKFIAACWESGLDFSSYLEAFTDILCEKSCDYFSALEAQTVIEDMKGPFSNEILKKNITRLNTVQSDSPIFALCKLVVKKFELMIALQ